MVLVYSRKLSKDPKPAEVNRNRRCLAGSDFDQWENAYIAFLNESGLPIQGTSDQRRINFNRQVNAGHWWGVFGGSKLIAMAVFNALNNCVGQVGGV